MSERLEHCLYQSGLTAQGCWDELDDYAKESIQKLAELIIDECVMKLWNMHKANIDHKYYGHAAIELKRHWK